jgi:hypothetical protein
MGPVDRNECMNGSCEVEVFRGRRNYPFARNNPTEFPHFFITNIHLNIVVVVGSSPR